MASREKKQIANKQLTSKKECPPIDKSTENIGAKSVISEKKKENLKKFSNQKQRSVKKNSKSAKSDHVNLGSANKSDIKNLSLQEKNVQSPNVAKCKPVSKKQTGNVTKCKQNTKESSDLQLNVKSNLGLGKKCKSNVITKCKVMGNSKSKTSMENVADQDSKDLLGLDETTFVNQLFATSVSQKRTQNTKFKKKYKKQISTTSVDICNGIRSRSTPYLTRSDSPIRVLRNGKRRKLKDPSMLDGLDSIEHAKKRRRVASVTKDGTTENDSNICELSQLQVESDNACANPRPVCDSELTSVQIGGGRTCKDECNDTIGAQDTKICECPCDNACVQNMKKNGQCVSELSSQALHDNKITGNKLSVDVQSTKCSAEATVTTTVGCHSSDVKKVDACGEYNLGKTISNRIAELIKRSKISETKGGSGSDDEGLVIKQDQQFCDSSAVFDASQKLMDSNSNVCDSSDIAKPCHKSISGDGMGASVACSKDKVISNSNIGIVLSELGGCSNHSLDAANCKVGQVPSDGASNISEVGSLLELNFSEVRAAISKKIQNCAKESSSDSLLYKDSIPVQDKKCNIHSEPLICKKQLNASVSSELIGPMSGVPEVCKNSNWNGKPAVLKSAQFLQQNKAKSCKRTLKESGENSSSCVKRTKIQRKPTRSIKKMQTSPHDGCNVGSNKKSVITKIVPHCNISSIAVGDLTISAVHPEMSGETGINENSKHCRQQNQIDARDVLEKCPCPDNCNNHLSYSCDVLKSNGLNGKITHTAETLETDRADILKMMEVFDFKDESDELSNQGKLLNPTLLVDCEGTGVVENTSTTEKSSCDEQKKCMKATVMNSGGSIAAINFHTAANSVSCKGSAKSFEGKLCGRTSVSVVDLFLCANDNMENKERVVPDLSVADTLDELLTRVSELNVLPFENAHMKMTNNTIDNNLVCAQDPSVKVNEEVQHLPGEIVNMDCSQTENCHTDTLDKNNEITTPRTCVDGTPHKGDEEHVSQPVSLIEGDSSTLEINARLSEQEMIVMEYVGTNSSNIRITKCDVGNQTNLKTISGGHKAECLNHLCSKNSSEPNENECGYVVQPSENKKSLCTVVTNSKDCKCGHDQVVKCKCTREDVVDSLKGDENLDVPDVETSSEELEIILRDVLHDILTRVEILVEGVHEEKSQVHCEMGRSLILNDEIKKMSGAEGGLGNLLEESMQVDSKPEETPKMKDEQGKHLCFESKLDALSDTEDVRTKTDLESRFEGLPQLTQDTLAAVRDDGSNLNAVWKLDGEPKELSLVGDAKLLEEDELDKFAVACRLESDSIMEELAVPECEVQGETNVALDLQEILGSKSSLNGTEIGQKGEVENGSEPEREQSYSSTLPEPAAVHVAEAAKVTGVGSLDVGYSTATTSHEIPLEQDIQKEENWESVDTKEEIDVRSESVILKKSQENFTEYEKIEKLEEAKEDVSTLEHFLEEKLVVCSENGEVDNRAEPCDEKRFEEESPEVQAVKESILSALGLQSLRAARAAAAAAAACEGGEREVISYTGTLKTVIKVSRSPDKKNSRVPVRTKKTRGPDNAGSSTDDVMDEHEGDDMDGVERIKYSICSESTSSSEVNKSASSPEQGLRKSVKLSTGHRSQNDVGMQLLGEKDSTVIKNQDDDGKASGKQDSNLIIPEKSSSFSIHPQRLCSDVCSYCFGKFGSLDTPCHIAQLKSLERQQNILSIETHLTADSCLCDACYRHVDRKANCPSYKPNRKRQHRSDGSHPKSLCCVQGCTLPAYHTVRRKWLLKLKRSIAKKVPIDMEKMPQHLPFPLCSQHYYWVDFFMVCGVCKRKLTRNHMYPPGSEVNDLNKYLIGDGIPVHLTDKIFLCKLCRYFCTLRLKHKDPSQLTGNHKIFFDSYRKRILHYNDIEVMDSDEVAEPIVMPSKSKRRKTKDKEGSADVENGTKAKNKSDVIQSAAATSTFVNLTAEQQRNEPEVEFISLGDAVSDTNRSGASTPLIDYSTLDTSAGTTTINIVSYDGDTVGKTAKQRTGQSLGNSGVDKPFYSGCEELQLHANFDFHRRPQDERFSKPGEWDKCTATIQFDKQTKKLFQQLQRPYGNHSSFFRHLILLEKYWRSGDLALTPNASQRAVSYVTSVNNRITSFDGHSLPSHSVPPATSILSSASGVPVIDLPLRRRLGSSGLGSPPIIVTSQGMTFTAVSPVSTATTSTSSVSCSPIFSSMPVVSSPSPTPVFSSPVPGSFLHGRRVPNVLQVTAGGKSFSIVPNMVQIKQLQALHRKQQLEKQRRDRQISGFVPLITDVRSLATDAWEQKNSAKANATTQSRQSKMSVTILPKPTPKVPIPALRPGVKPSTVVTPTGIILSKTPELSVIAMPVETAVPVLPAVRSDTPGS